MATETSEAERRATGAERELMDWKTAQFMEAHLGEEYDALIISIQKFGCFVELFEVLWKGFFPSMPWKNSQAPAASIANAITPWSPYQVRKAAVAGLASAMAEAPRQNRWNGISATAFVSARTHRPMRKRVEFALVSGN